MIKGIGCDIVQISRIQESIEKFGDKFLNRIFSPEELALAPSNSEKKLAYLANRFAAKEAFAKALGTGIGEMVEFKDISVLNHQSGQPYLVAPKHLEHLKIHLSISDEIQYSIAMIVLE